MSTRGTKHEVYKATPFCGWDELELSRVIFIAVGVGYLFPFLALSMPVDYWVELFPDHADVDATISGIYFVTNLSTQIIISYFSRGNPNYSKRVYAGLTGQFIAIVVVPTSYFWGLSESANFALLAIFTTFAAICTGAIDSCIIAMAALYPTTGCSQSLQIGIGVSILIGSMYRVISKLVFADDAVVASSLVFFYAAGLTVLFCMLCFYTLNNLAISDKYVYDLDGTYTRLARQDSSDVLAAEERQREREEREPMIGGASSSNHHQHINNGSDDGTYGTVEDSTVSQPGPSIERRSRSGTESFNALRWEALQRVWWNELIVFLLFSTTLILWPALISEIPSYSFPTLNDTEWWPIILLFCFAVMDVTGRFSSSHTMGFTALNIHIAVFARFAVFVPLIIACVKGWIQSDFLSVVIVSTFGFTSGYFGAMSIVLVDSLAPPEEKAIVGSITGFVLTFGLAVGAAVAIFVDNLANLSS
jgi:equilibrative nucleoside transporter 1/2/3